MNFERADAFCATLPEAQCERKWGGVMVWMIDRKMFAMFREGQKEGDPHFTRLSFAAGARFLELTDQPGFEPAPYMARAHWVAVTDPRRVTDAHIKPLLKGAYCVIAQKLSKRRQLALATAYPRFDFRVDPDPQR